MTTPEQETRLEFLVNRLDSFSKFDESVLPDATIDDILNILEDFVIKIENAIKVETK